MGDLAGIVATFAAAATEDAGERARALLEDPAFQRTLPVPKPPPEPLHWSLGGLDLPVRTLLLGAAYLGTALLVAAVAWWLYRRLRPRTRDVAPAKPAAAPGPVAIPTANAEALAAAGRYGEAIHQLLLDTLGALSRAARLDPSLTSREIVARVSLAPRAREALAGLVAAVELSFFGGEPPGEPDYRACVERFETFLASYRRAA